MKIKFEPQTVVLLMGPSGCGKSYFAESLKTQAQSLYKVHILSSDELRRDILGDENANKFSKSMLHASNQAFKLLETKLEVLTSFPIQSDLIIVDCTSLNKDFREHMGKLINRLGYHSVLMIFDYKDRSDFRRFVEPGSDQHQVTIKHIDRLKKQYSQMKAAAFDKRISIEKPIFCIRNEKLPDVITSWSDSAVLKASVDSSEVFEWEMKFTNQKSDNKTLVIGDVHGCIEELEDLLEKASFTKTSDYTWDTHGTDVVLVGDLVDKGPDSLAVLKTACFSGFIKVFGNHEERVHSYLTGALKKENFSIEFYDSCVKYAGDEEFLTYLSKYVENSVPFYRNENLIVSHSATKTEHLGKLKHANKHTKGNYPFQEDFASLEAYEDALDKFFKEYSNENLGACPLHVFGHVPFKTPSRIGFHLGIDTGCCFGGSLSAVLVEPSGKYSTISVPSKQTKKFELPEINKEVDSSDFTAYEESRLRYILKNNVQFISGTVAPADKSDGDLENFDKAFDYFKDEEVCVQLKHMGSRCQMYISEDACMAVSRNGFEIASTSSNPKGERSILYKEKLLPIFEKLKTDYSDLIEGGKTIILDGELMPWRFLGHTLIERDFDSLATCMKEETENLLTCGFQSQLDRVIQAAKSRADQNKHAQTVIDTCRSFNFPNLVENLEDAHEFEKQLSIYAKKEKEEEIIPIFEPFALLKIYDENFKEFYNIRNETSVSDNFKRATLNKQPCMVFAANDVHSREVARDWFEQCREQGLEGLMIKSETNVMKPPIKIRNKDYLRIIYGPDYLREHRLKKLLWNKRVGGKLRQSTKELTWGMRMLNCQPNSRDMKYFAMKMIMEERESSKLDPRL